jgi:hypothetical protein
LSCGHSLDELVDGREGRYCGACQDELRREPVRSSAGAPGSDLDRPAAALRADAEGDPDEVLEGEIEPEPPSRQPVYGTLGTAPGPRGCWAVKKDGTPCGAAAWHGEPYCTAHLGRGVASDPAAANIRAAESRKRTLEHRARMRVALGDTRATSARGMLKLATAQRASEVAARVLDAVLDENVDAVKAGKLGLEVIREVEPVKTLEVEVGLPTDVAALDRMTTSELYALAELLNREAPALEAPSKTPA